MTQSLVFGSAPVTDLGCHYSEIIAAVIDDDDAIIGM